MLAHTVSAKALSLAAYAALGWLLTEREFGVYAFGLGIAFFAQAFQDRGVREILISEGPQRFLALYRAALRYGTAINLAAAGGIVLVGLLLRAAGAAGAQDRDFLLVVGLIAIGVPLTSPWAVAVARLSLEYRFRMIALVGVLAAAVQYGGAVLLAARGWGAVGLALALALASGLRGAIGSILLLVWRLESHQAPETYPFLRSSGWIIAGALGLGAAQQGDYVAAGILLPPAVVGIYYFAYQVPFQLVSLLGASLQSVLLPWFADENRTLPSAAVRSMDRASQVLVLSAAVTSSVLLALAPFLEAVVWRGTWTAAIGPLQVLCLFMPFRAMVEPPKAYLLATGRFKRWGLESAGLAACTVGGALTGAVFGASAWSLAMGVGVGSATGGIGLWWRTRRLLATGETPSGWHSLIFAYGAAMLPAWALASLTWAGYLQPEAGAAYGVAATTCLLVSAGLVLTSQQTILRDVLRVLGRRESHGKHHA